MEKITLKNLTTGTIDLVHLNGDLTVLQFNASCVDALPFCKAACCRMRASYNVVLQKDEIERFQSIPDPNDSRLRIIATDGNHCLYLDPSSHCKVHADKPQTCREWHCSPGGSNSDGTRPKYHAMGWALLPLGGRVPV